MKTVRRDGDDKDAVTTTSLNEWNGIKLAAIYAIGLIALLSSVAGIAWLWRGHA